MNQTRAAPSFNLITEPWLPVSLEGGQTAEWGLSDLFARAHEARGLNEPSPLTYTAVLRTLVAVLHRALDGPQSPKDWMTLYRAGQFDAEAIEAYLHRWAHRFDLYHPERPFAQVDCTVEMTDDSPVTRLLMERTSGNNPTLFDHAWDENPPALSPAEAARAVLAAHAYAFAGAGGRFMQSPMVAGYAITLDGATLFETLMLNMYGYRDSYLEPMLLRATGDTPWWEWDHDPPPKKEGAAPRGLTDLLTWRSRRIRLLPEPDGSVRRIQYSQGHTIRDPVLELRDPFKRYVRATSGTNAGAAFPKNFTAGRALWRDVDALIENAGSYESHQNDHNQIPAIIDWAARVSRVPNEEVLLRPSIVATGLVNNQAKIDLWRMERLPLPIQLLQDAERQVQVKRAIDIAQKVRDALFQAGSTFATQVLTVEERNPEKAPDPADIARERSALKLDERYWSQLEHRFQQFMIALAGANDLDAPLRTWMAELRQIAWRVYNDATRNRGSTSAWWKGWVKGSDELSIQLAKLGLGKERGQQMDGDDDSVVQLQKGAD